MRGVLVPPASPALFAAAVWILIGCGFRPTYAYSEGTKQLLFVQSLWRHGDRSPTRTFKSDGYQEDAWTFGGGGWGQLSPTGMRQHLNLGKLLRSRYVDSMQFLPKVYNSKKIYVRSTDVNRTLISAMSNMMGMYGQDGYGAQAGQDYPDVAGWPAGFVPIAVHTVDDNTDHMGNMDSKCSLEDQTWALAKKNTFVSNFTSQPDVQDVLAKMSQYCNQTIDIDNLWIPVQALFIEQIYKNDTLRQKNPWFTEDFYDQADDINDQVELFNNGIFPAPNVIQGVDVGLMLRKQRGGLQVNDMQMHMNLKLACQKNTSADCTWINNLQYFAYSAHDTTLYAFFSALLVEQYAVKPKGYPLYSACVVIELYVDSADGSPYFKMLYHAMDGANFTAITSGIPGCPPTSDFCPLSIFQGYADLTRPDQPMDQWCQTDLFKSSTIASVLSLVLVICAFFTRQF